MPYQLFCKSVRGASHIKRDIPCEDYGLKYENSEIGCKIFVLGDGHGDPNCVRSQIGSRAVCEIAAEELRSFAEILNEDKKKNEEAVDTESESEEWIAQVPKSLTETLLDPDTAGEMLYQLIRSIVGKWGIYVTEHYENNPFTEEEKEIASEMLDIYLRGEHIEHIYGTTMIAGLMTEDYLLILHQGDGRCVVFDCEGAVSQPVPWDDRCVGNMTTSMCEYDALESCRFHVIDLKKNPVIACVFGSDGVEDSFNSMDRMHIFYREQLAIACEEEMGIEGLETYWESSLPTFSATGSRDDVTICGVMDIDAFREKLELMDVENDIVALKETIIRIDERIPQMQVKEDYLFNKKKDGAMAYNKLAEQYRKLEEEYTGIQRDLQEAQKNDTQSQGNFFQAIQTGAQNFMERFRLSLSSRRCLENRLDSIRREKADLEKELRIAEAEQEKRIKEYDEYRKEREALQETRVYKAEKLKACQDEYQLILKRDSQSGKDSESVIPVSVIAPEETPVNVNPENSLPVLNTNEWNGTTETIMEEVIEPSEPFSEEELTVTTADRSEETERNDSDEADIEEAADSEAVCEAVSAPDETENVSCEEAITVNSEETTENSEM